MLILISIMGSLLSKLDIFHRNTLVQSATTSYSWDKRREESLNENDYIVKNLINTEKWQLPGSLNGQQYIIQNCVKSKIFVLDFTNTVIVDDCSECVIILGPVKRSIFVRDSCECKFIVACEQFRLRDCKNLDVSLYCATRPIIESCTAVVFSCFQLYYDRIQEHFEECELNVWNNIWYKVHDYTPSNENDDPNWRYNDTKNILRVAADSCGISTEEHACCGVVPLTVGTIRTNNSNEENCFVAFHDEQDARLFAQSFFVSKRTVRLIKSRQITMNEAQVESLFLTSLFVKSVRQHPIIGLHVYGSNAIQICKQEMARACETSSFYVSPTSNMASHQVNMFFSIADLDI